MIRKNPDGSITVGILPPEKPEPEDKPKQEPAPTKRGGRASKKQ